MDRSTWKTALKLLAPYLAVLVFWNGLANGWLAILAYHAQILFWLPKRRAVSPTPVGIRALKWALPMALAGPALYFLLPFITRVELSAWLSDHRLSGWSLAAMIPYFGLVHPILEQRHWGPLRERTAWAHPFFAGYHALVLASLLSGPWLALCLAVLLVASGAWHVMTMRFGGLTVPTSSHVLADLGVVLAAWLSG